MQECIKTKEKLAATEADLSEKALRLGSVSAELGESQSRIKSLEDERQRQEKTISKLSADNKELVRSITSRTPTIYEKRAVKTVGYSRPYIDGCFLPTPTSTPSYALKGESSLRRKLVS